MNTHVVMFVSTGIEFGNIGRWFADLLDDYSPLHLWTMMIIFVINRLILII